MTAPSAVSSTKSMYLSAVVAGVEADEGHYGPRLTWWFEADGPDGPTKLRTWTTRYLSPQSRATSHLKAILGRTPARDQPFDFESLNGLPCGLEIAPNQAGYLVIKAVLPPESEIPF